MKIERIKFGKTKPLGKIRDIMVHDLSDGFIGHLDELLPTIIDKDDIYGRDRRTMEIKKMDLGLKNFDSNLTGEYMWWNSEGQGNWMDGFIRSAFLTGVMCDKATQKLRHLLDTIGEDGYLGIYQADSRYVQGHESGELWAQSIMLRAITAYYELTGDKKLLDVIKKSADLTMEGYPIEKSRPFSCDDEPAGTSCGGLSHGLTITDTFYFLYKETGEKKYIDYAVWLYESASAEPEFHSDIPLKNLMDENYRLKFHGVHTYEHLRTLAIAKFFGDKEEFDAAFDSYLRKVEPCLCPSGGPTGNEWINGNYADATKYGYEYCSIQELFHSWAMLLELTGDMKFADKAEQLFYNAGLGAHHPVDSSITYLKTDNSYALRSVFSLDELNLEGYKHYGYKYSPTHQDMAVCCVPNAGRLFPYFYGYMWQRTDTGFLKALYGASVFEEKIGNNTVRITEISDYPYSGKIKFNIDCDSPTKFSLSLRIPEWCGRFSVSEDYNRENRVITIDKLWHHDTVELNLEFLPKAHKDIPGDTYFTYGPMTMALPIVGIERIVEEAPHTLPGFFDKEYDAANKDYVNLHLASEKATADGNGVITAEFVDSSTGEHTNRTLVPMGDTILRRVTFPL